jgi:hypothetical protein
MTDAPSPTAPAAAGAAAELPRRDGRAGWHRHGGRGGDGCGEGNEAGRQQPILLLSDLRSRAFCDLLYRYLKTGSSPMSKSRVTLLVCALLLASVACCLGGNAHAQTCSCKGSMLDHYKDGDSKPLIWTFEPYLVKPGVVGVGPSWICYFKTVSNESKIKVLRIYWEVASFYRKFVSPNSSVASCPTIADEMKTSPRNGPLYHGITGRYDTTVREPTDGWKETRAAPRIYQRAAEDYDIREPTKLWRQAQASRELLSPIESSFVVDLEGSPAPQRAVIKIVSSGYRFGGSSQTELLYELSNSGNAALRVLVNLPNDGQLSTRVPIVSNPVVLGPEQPLKFSYVTSRTISLQHATVIFYDQPGKEIVGVESAGFYGLAEGKREVDAQFLWRSLRSGN